MRSFLISLRCSTYDEFKEGMKLFADNFLDLWD